MKIDTQNHRAASTRVIRFDIEKTYFRYVIVYFLPTRNHDRQIWKVFTVPPADITMYPNNVDNGVVLYCNGKYCDITEFHDNFYRFALLLAGSQIASFVTCHKVRNDLSKVFSKTTAINDVIL